MTEVMRSEQKPRFLLAVDAVMSAEMAVRSNADAQRAKATPFARGRRSDVR